MYKLLVWGLTVLSVYSLVLSLLKLNGLDFLESFSTLLVLLVSGILFHFVFSKLWSSSTNIDSTIISLLILFLIVAPMQKSVGITNLQGYLLPIILSFCVVASKYILQLNKVHIWNPVVFALVVNGFLLDGFNMWQIGSKYMFIPVCIFAYLIIRKQRLAYLFFIYISIALATSMIFNVENALTFLFIKNFFISGPSIFFASVMLTEPSTLPDSRNRRYFYAAFVGLLSNISVSHSSPEVALFIANIFSYFTSFRKRIFLKFVEKKEIGANTFEFVFSPNEAVRFMAGQYGELTVPHKNVDTRGMRRYFTIASAPQDRYIKFGVRFTAKDGSSFKRALMNLKEGEEVILNSINGEFILPENKAQNVVFIAGGIGITPFLSFEREEKFQNDKRKMTLFNLNKSELDITCREELKMCELDGVKIVNIVGNFLTEENIRNNVDVTLDNKYYLSGPPKMVEVYESLLRKIGIKNSKIMTDYFPGYN